MFYDVVLVIKCKRQGQTEGKSLLKHRPLLSILLQKVFLQGTFFNERNKSYRSIIGGIMHRNYAPVSIPGIFAQAIQFASVLKPEGTSGWEFFM